MTESQPQLVRVLFVCVGNCVRSQMAEAIARHSASDVIEPQSAGVHPLGFIDPTTLAVLQSRKISTDGQYSKGLHAQHVDWAELVVNMSGMPSTRLFHHKSVEDWEIADPFGEGIETHGRICDDISARVATLAERLRVQTGEGK